MADHLSPARPKALARRALPTACMLWILLLAWPTSAQESVVVTYHGGTEQADIFELTGDPGGPQVASRGPRRLISPDLGPQVIFDHKIMPDRSNLLAGVGGRGLMVTDEQGDERFRLGAPDALPRSTAASVTLFASPDEIARALLGDSNDTRLLLVEFPEGEEVWQAGLRLPGSAGRIVAISALPGSRAAAAVEFTGLGLSAIDLFAFSAGPSGSRVRRLTNREHAEGPADQVAVDGLHPIQDMIGLPDEDLLVATDERVYQVSLEGEVRWSQTLVGLDEIRGRLSSIALMPSGRLAVATLQEGQWTSPHPNHRVHWLDREALSRGIVDTIARTPPLRQAPVSIETLGGHGASGTFGYRPGLDDAAEGSLADLVAARELSFDRRSYPYGGQLRASVVLRNDGSEPVFLSDMRILAQPGDCDADDDLLPLELASQRYTTLPPGELVAFDALYEVSNATPTGRWCAQVQVRDRAGARATVGAAAYFEVVEALEDAGGQVTVRDVGYWPADAFSPDTPSPPPTGESSGCAHSGAGTTPTPIGLTLALAWWGLGRLRREKTHRPA